MMPALRILPFLAFPAKQQQQQQQQQQRQSYTPPAILLSLT